MSRKPKILKSTTTARHAATYRSARRNAARVAKTLRYWRLATEQALAAHPSVDEQFYHPSYQHTLGILKNVV